MRGCSFFGHRENIKLDCNRVCDVILKLIHEQNISRFYVGNQGEFDKTVYHAFCALAPRYPNISFAVVPAFSSDLRYKICNSVHLLLPQGIENINSRDAIPYRNRWMIERSVFIVSYITHTNSNAARFAGEAAKQGCTVINLATAYPT